jgi:hypothetical protein
MMTILTGNSNGLNRSGMQYTVIGDSVRTTDLSKKKEDFTSTQVTWNSPSYYSDYTTDYGKLSNYEVEADTPSGYKVQISAEFANSTIFQVILGLTHQYVNRVLRNGKFPDSKQFRQGLDSLGWTKFPEVKITDNFVTNQPHFQINEEKLCFEALLVALIDFYEVSLGGV